MKTGMATKLTALAFVTASLTGSAWAAGNADGSGFYIGLGAGASSAKIDSGSINSDLQSLGFSSATTSTDEGSVAYKAFAGYSFNKYIAIEGGYFDLGTFKFNSTVTPPGTLNGEIKSSGFNLGAVLSYPFGQGFSVFGRVGVQNAKTKVNYTSTGSVLVINPESSETKTNWDAGLGLGYQFANGIGVRAEWERYRVPDGTNTDNTSNVDLFGISVVYKF
jgi:OOP family OmpA-OmpF porin